MPKYKIISTLIVALCLLSGIEAKVSCHHQWGPASVSKNSCLIQKEKTNEPSSVLIQGVNWNPRTESFAIRMKINNPESLGGYKLSFLKRGKVQASYTLPLYTDPQYNIFQQGLDTWLSIASSSLKKETTDELGPFNGMTLYLSHKGAASPLEIEILDFKTIPKPKKGFVSITFDDGYQSNFIAAKVMKERSLPGTAYLIPETLGKKGYLSEEEVAKMRSWGWSLSTHLKTPVTEIKNLEKTIALAKKTIGSLGSPPMANHFALPLGKYNSSSLAMLKKHFSSIRLAGGGYETLPLTDPSRLKTINVTDTTTPAELFAMCQKAIMQGDWAILMFHYLGDSKKGELNYPTEGFQSLINQLAPYKANILPVDKIFHRFAPKK